MLEIRDLVKVYPGPVAALQGLSLSVPRGMFGLLGPNGSGKSTLMRILAGLLAPSSGHVRFGEIDIARTPQQIWPRLGYLPQDFGFYPDLTGAEMLQHLLALKGIAATGRRQALCHALLERVNLAAAAHRKVKTYSGGMRQRLGIAQAIAGEPDLLVVDEPTAGLDPEERLRFYGLLAELADTRTILLSTHIVEDIGTLCPRFAVIRGGRLLLHATPASARASLRGRVFEGSASAVEMQDLPANQSVIQQHLVEGRHRVRLLVEHDAPPPGFVAAEPTLEDAYLLLMREAASDPDAAVAEA